MQRISGTRPLTPHSVRGMKDQRLLQEAGPESREEVEELGGEGIST